MGKWIYYVEDDTSIMGVGAVRTENRRISGDGLKTLLLFIKE